MKLGLYEVMGKLSYRDHRPGETFVARLDRGAEARAVHRGNIRLLELIEPTLPQQHGLPDGWITAEPDESTDTPAGVSVVERGK